MAKDKIKKLEKELETLRNKPNKGVSGRRKVQIFARLGYAFHTSDSKKAKAYCMKGLALAKDLRYAEGIADSYLSLGCVYWVNGLLKKALRCYFEASRLYEREGNRKGVANSYTDIVCVYHSEGDFDRMLEYQLKALKIYEEIGDKEGLLFSYEHLATIYAKGGDYANSMKLYRKSMRLSMKIGSWDTYAAACSNIGQTYLEQKNDSVQALKYFRKALKIQEKTHNKLHSAKTHIYISKVYERQGRYQAAIQSILESLKLSREIGSTSDLSHAYCHLGHIHTKCKRYDKALECLRKALEISKKIKAKELVLECMSNMIELHIAEGDYKKAFLAYKKRSNLEIKFLNIVKGKQMAEMRTKYETRQKEKEAEMYQLKNVRLRSEIKKRKKTETELKKHRDQLEELVEKRTIALRRELRKRQSAEIELLKHQNQLVALNHALSLVEEKQRRKTATYLHDNIGQALSLAIFKIRSLQESDPAKNVKKELAEIKDIVAQTNQRTRSLTFEISPPVLYELGLEPAVEWIAGQFQTQHGITCSFKNDGSSKPLKDETRILLFQAVRELLNNVSKHARAQTVKVSTSRQGNEIRISVADDGVGFNPGSLGLKITHNEGFGLFNIKERLRHLGGKLEVNSDKGQGTSIVLIAPLKRTQRKTNRKRR